MLCHGCGEELSVAQGVLKVNSKILEGHELKKLDKLEKSLVNGLHITGKGRIELHYIIDLMVWWLLLYQTRRFCVDFIKYLPSLKRPLAIKL